MLAFGVAVLFGFALRENGYDAHLFGRFMGPKACFLALARVPGAHSGGVGVCPFLVFWVYPCRIKTLVGLRL